MTQEVAKRETTAVSTNVAAPAQETILQSDVIIPRVLLMQGLSALVADRKAMQGDIVRSTTAEKLGDDKGAIKFIPLTYRLRWMLEEVIGTKKTFKGFEERNETNENAPWEFEKDGAPWRRIKVIEVFALLPKDVQDDLDIMKACAESGEIPDVNKVLLPVVISFRSTSYRAGQEVISHFMKVRAFQAKGLKLQPCHYTLTLGCKSKENQKGKFFVWDIPSGAGFTEAAHLGEASRWYGILTSSAAANLKVDEAEETMSQEAASEPAEAMDNGQY